MNGFGLRRDVLVPLYRSTYTELRKYMVELSGNSMSIYKREGGREGQRGTEREGRDRQAIKEADRQVIKEPGRQARRQAGKQ